MKIEDLFDIREEESKKYLFTGWLIEEIKKINSPDDNFVTREELLEKLEDYLVNFSIFMTDDYIMNVMLGEYQFPLPNRYEWDEEQFDKIHKRYRKLKRMNRLSK